MSALKAKSHFLIDFIRALVRFFWLDVILASLIVLFLKLNSTTSDFFMNESYIFWIYTSGIFSLAGVYRAYAIYSSGITLPDLTLKKFLIQIFLLVTVVSVFITNTKYQESLVTGLFVSWVLSWGIGIFLFNAIRFLARGKK